MNQKLSNIYIKKEIRLVKEFLFIVVGELYEEFKNRSINKKIRKGNFIINWRVLTQQELVEILFNCILECYVNDFEFNLDLVCERVEEELCNPKYFFGGVKEPSIIFDFCDATGTDSYETHFRCRLWDLLADEAQLITLGAQDNVPISLCTECYSNDSDDSINAYFTAFMGKNKARRILTIKDLEN